jgi:hypothetical protein
MIRSIVLNETNFKTIMHHIHKLKEHRYVGRSGIAITLTNDSNVNACKALDHLIDMRLFREEKQVWIEKALVMRIWLGTTNSCAENILEQLHELLDAVSQNTKAPLSAPATHAVQTVC